MKKLCAALLLLGTVGSADAGSVSKTYSYFSIGGTTLEEIENELNTHGPQVKSSGRRHPGATQMEFTTRIKYAENVKRCKVVEASVSVKAKVILPKWRRSKGAGDDVRMVWDTLASDIKRHEESHVVIAKNHARELEDALKKMWPQKTCEAAADKAKALSDKILSKHDRAQEEFDRVEGLNFESRLIRLLRYRMERIQDGRLPG